MTSVPEDAKRDGWAPTPPWSISEYEFRAELTDARVARIGNLPEAAAADVPARIQELRVVENVKEFRANLERHGFLDGNDLRYSEIGVVDAGAVEESAVRVSKASAISTNQRPCRT